MIFRKLLAFQFVVTLVLLTFTHTLIVILSLLVESSLVDWLTLINHLLIIIWVQFQSIYNDFLLDLLYLLYLVKHMLMMCGLLVVVERWRVLDMVKSWNDFVILRIAHTPQITLIFYIIPVWDRWFKHDQRFNYRFLINNLLNLYLSYVVFMVIKDLFCRFTIVLTAFNRLYRLFYRFVLLIWLLDVSQDNLLNWNKGPQMLLGHFL
jgi:hypothetical protein